MKNNENLKFTQVTTDQIHLPERHLVKISKEELETTIRFVRKHGQVMPVIVDNKFNIVNGFNIFEACRALQHEKIAVVKIGELTEDQIYQYTIALDKITSMGELDFSVIDDKLKLWFCEDEKTFELDDLCITSVELDNLLFTSPLEEKESEEKSAELEENPLDEIKHITKLGDLIQLGRHRLYCGDSKLRTSFEKCMKDEKAHIVIADPPYGCKIQGNVTTQKHHKEFVEGSDEPTSEEFVGFLSNAITNLKDFSLNNSVHYLFMDWRRCYDLQTACKEIYPKLLNIACWCKKQPGMGSFYRSMHEFCLIYQNGIGKHTNNITLGSNGRNRSNVWNYAGMNTSTKDAITLRKLHSTVKPVSMLMDILLDASELNEIVLDCFGGSGSTLIAAEQTGRSARLIELNPEYCDVIIARWEALTNKKAVVLESVGE